MPIKNFSPVVLLALLAGCGWNNLPQQDTHYLDDELWDPNGVVPTEDGLYVPLPLAGGVALVPQSGEATRIDIGEGNITRLTPSPDDKTIIAILERYTCDEDDPKLARKIKVPDDCDAEDLVVHTELNVISNGEISSEIDVKSQFNTVEFSDDGRFAIAYLDFSQGDVVLSGVVDLTSVMVLDVLDGTSTPVTVGFSANKVLFTYDENEQAERAVVLSENSVAVVDLFEETPVLDVTFPLTLDPDSNVVPVGVELTPDGQYALISVEKRSD
ncbi:MAG: hypothetical protein HN348_23520, partial [Proteobacteria bacterium]|nr:hypothetical protein [Pseudomonadota bacterium]